MLFLLREEYSRPSDNISVPFRLIYNTCSYTNLIHTKFQFLAKDWTKNNLKSIHKSINRGSPVDWHRTILNSDRLPTQRCITAVHDKRRCPKNGHNMKSPHSFVFTTKVIKVYSGIGYKFIKKIKFLDDVSYLVLVVAGAFYRFSC